MACKGKGHYSIDRLIASYFAVIIVLALTIYMICVTQQAADWHTAETADPEGLYAGDAEGLLEEIAIKNVAEVNLHKFPMLLAIISNIPTFYCMGYSLLAINVEARTNTYDAEDYTTERTIHNKKTAIAYFKVTGLALSLPILAACICALYFAGAGSIELGLCPRITVWAFLGFSGVGIFFGIHGVRQMLYDEDCWTGFADNKIAIIPEEQKQQVADKAKHDASFERVRRQGDDEYKAIQKAKKTPLFLGEEPTIMDGSRDNNEYESSVATADSMSSTSATRADSQSASMGALLKQVKAANTSKMPQCGSAPVAGCLPTEI